MENQVKDLVDKFLETPSAKNYSILEFAMIEYQSVYTNFSTRIAEKRNER